MSSYQNRCDAEFESRREREAIGEDRSHLRVRVGDTVRCDECGGEHVARLGGHDWLGKTVMIVDCPETMEHAVAWPTADGKHFERDECACLGCEIEEECVADEDSDD